MPPLGGRCEAPPAGGASAEGVSAERLNALRYQKENLLIDKPITIQISENYAAISEKILKQTAILRWGKLSRKRLVKGIDSMRRDPFGFVSFYVFALAGKKVVGFAYFAQGENEPSQWWWGDLVVHPRHRREGIAAQMLEQGILMAKEKNAAKLITYIDYDNEASLAFHQKHAFVLSETQEPFNGFLVDGRAVYEREL